MKLKTTFLFALVIVLFESTFAQQPPQIILQPVDQNVCPGDSAGVCISAIGNGELQFQWQKDNVDLEGETDSICFTLHAWEIDEGNYTCVVSNEFGSDTSDAASLLVDSVLPTQIWGMREVENYDTVLYSIPTTPNHNYEFFVERGTVVSLTDTTIKVGWGADDVGYVKVLESSENGCYGDTVSKMIIVGDVVPFFLSQPLSQTVCLDDSAYFEVEAAGTSELDYQWQLDGEDIYRETSRSLTVNPVRLEDEGEYTCIVTNSVGSDTSEPAQLDIDLVEPAQIIGSASVDVNDTIVYSVVPVLGHLYDFSVSNGTPLAVSDTSIAVLWDTTGISYINLVETNTLGCEGDTVNYQVLVYGEGAMVIFLEQPESYGVCLNETAVFEVEASGYPELIYQWQKDGVDIEEANESSYTIPVTEYEDEGGYTCIVSNDFGSATSEVAMLSVDEIIPTDILGPQYVSEFEVSVYSVPLTEGHVYEFSAIGGNIIQSTQNSVQVQWGSSGYGMIRMLESVENGCVGEWVELEIFIGTVGINPKNEVSFSINPNPVSDFVSIKLTGQNSLEIYDILGNMLISKKFENELQLNLSHLDKGMYIYRINDIAGRIIKN